LKHIAWLSFFIMFAATINTIFSEKITLNVGDAAPQFTLENQDGVFEELSDYIGQRVVVYFFPMADTPG
jgi:peroxiredoxin